VQSRLLHTTLRTGSVQLCGHSSMDARAACRRAAPLARTRTFAAAAAPRAGLLHLRPASWGSYEFCFHLQALGWRSLVHRHAAGAADTVGWGNR
jgi:hypothetical protein